MKDRVILISALDRLELPVFVALNAPEAYRFLGCSKEYYYTQRYKRGNGCIIKGYRVTSYEYV